MTTKDAINRLSYTISNANKPNTTDKVALNTLITTFNKVNDETVQENVLFAKLYVILLKQRAGNYQDIDFANKQINKDLALPLLHHIEVLKSELNSIELNNYFNEKGIKDPFLVGTSLTNIQTRLQENKNIFKDISFEEIKSIFEMWDLDSTIAHINATVTQSVITYKNV